MTDAARPGRRLAALAIALAVAVGCADRPDVRTGSAPAPSTSVVLSERELEVEHAISLREALGLRADEAYVRAVVEDPAVVSAALSGYGIPMLPAEIANVENRPAIPASVANFMQGYARLVSEEWAGLYVDNTTGGTVVGLFTDNLEHHRRELAKRLDPNAPYRLEQVRWSLDQLTALAERINADEAWFTTLDVTTTNEAEVFVMDNVVRLELETDRPELAEMTAAHFAAGDLLVVTVSGMTPWDGGFGELIVRATLPDGEPMTMGLCEIQSLEPRAHIEFNVLHLDERGACTFPEVPATDVLVRIVDEALDPIAEGRGTVPRGGMTVVEVVPAD